MNKMQPTPCDIHEYDSDDYNSCIKDIVYEQAQDEWIMLDPRFPNLKGLTPKRIDEFLENMEDMKEYTEDYLQHVMVYDRDDIVSMCYDLGKQIEEKYPGKLHSPHSIFVTTPRGGYEVLSIFAYTNNLDKEQLPSHIRSISEEEYLSSIVEKERYENDITKKEFYNEAIDTIKQYEKRNLPIIPDIWLYGDVTTLTSHKIENVFIIDDIIASGQQIAQAHTKINEFFKRKVEIIPIVLVERKDWVSEYDDDSLIYEKTLYTTETVGLEKWNKARRITQPGKFIEPLIWGERQEKEKAIYDKLITVRFPWGSPDGESDKILTTLYEGRRGFDRIERKQRRCSIEPDACELK